MLNQPNRFNYDQGKSSFIPCSKNRSSYNAAQCLEYEAAPLILAQICDTLKDKELPYTTGRRPFPLSKMIFELGLRTMKKLSLRRSIGAINAHDTELQDCQRSIGHYSTMSNFLRKPELTPILRELIVTSSLPLSRYSHYFAIDATGFSSKEKRSWAEVIKDEVKTINYSLWQQLHICVDTETKIITDAIVERGKDNVNFRILLETTSKHFNMEEVYGDKMYCTRANYNFARRLEIEAFMPFKSNATGKTKGSSEWKTKFKLFTERREDFYAHYHADHGRSNIETVMFMIKANLAQRIRSRDKSAQKNEILLKVLCHNVLVLHQLKYQYGIDIDFRPLSERETLQIPVIDPQYTQLSPPLPTNETENPIAKPVTRQKNVLQHIEPKHRKCIVCGSKFTDKTKNGSDFWHRWKGREWYCHTCYMRRYMRKWKGITKSRRRVKR